MIALDRYRGILWPLKGGYSKFRAKIHLMIVWFLATVVALPNLILFHVSQDLVSFRPALAATCHAWPLPLITLSKLERGKVAGRWGFSWFCTSEKMYLWSLSFSLSHLKGFRVAFWWLVLDFFQLADHPHVEGKFGCIVDMEIVGGDRTWKNYTLVAVFVQYCVPLSVITFCHCHMAKVSPQCF